jgi:uncharacterized protein DUF6159
MTQFKRGLGIAGHSWRTLRSHRSLAAFPILGGAMALVVVAPPALAGAYLADRGDTVLGALLGAVAIYLVCFVSAFVGVGLAAAADAALRGEDASFGQGLRVATSRLGAISGWALITALLSIVLFAGAAVLSNALRQIFAVALFRFTTSGEAIGGFDAADLEHAVRVKRRPAVA